MNATYPQSPGHKEKNGTSQESAERTECRVEKLRRLVKESLAAGGLTADECAGRIGETPFSIRPRFTELLRFGEIEKTQERRKNDSGHSAWVWQLVKREVQEEMFA